MKIKPWEVSYYKAERESEKLLNGTLTDFVDFTNTFHNLIYILKGIWDISPKEIKTELSGSFFPDIVKMIRETKQHSGNDFFNLEYSGIPGIGMQGGELSMRIEDKFIFYGKELPKGDYVFGKEFFTLNGKPFNLGIPIIRIFKFKEIDENDKNEKKCLKWKDEFSKYDPFQFIIGCMKYYNEKIINVT
jgi:hypothetical protein